MVAELQSKGFQLIKKGDHSPVKATAKGGAVEDSDIYLRRIVDGDGKEYFEAIRIDRKFGGGTTRPFGTAEDGILQSPKAKGEMRSQGISEIGQAVSTQPPFTGIDFVERRSGTGWRARIIGGWFIAEL